MCKIKKTGERPHIIFITLDCVRPDHIGITGNKNVKTPAIDSLAKSGVIFEQAYSQAPNTWVSHASIFTGCNPPKHGLHAPCDKIRNNVSTISEVLSQNGYYTIGFPAHNLVGKFSNFHKGFNIFYEADFKFPSKINGMKWGNNWKKVLKIADKEIKKYKHFPLFIWFHYMNTHHFPDNNIPLPYLYRLKFSARWQYYNGKISYADKFCISNIISILKKHNILKNTIVVIFSDHGEKLEEGQKPEHDDTLSDDVLRILLLMSGPGIPVNRNIKTLVRAIDIFPTILDILKIDFKNMDIDGISLKPLLETNHLEEKWAYSENIPKNFISIRTPVERLVANIETTKLNNKYQIKIKHFTLYNAQKDGKIIADEVLIPSVLKTELKNKIYELEKSLNSKIMVENSDKKRIIEHLKSLGYI